MDNFTNYILGLGLALIILEAIFGFSVIWLFTLGLSLIITAGLLVWDILEPNILNLLFVIPIIDTVLTFVLWKPMKFLQRDKVPNKVKNDLIGNIVQLKEDTGPGVNSSLEYSGVTWKVKCKGKLRAGSVAVIEGVDVGEITVRPVR